MDRNRLWLFTVLLLMAEITTFFSCQKNNGKRNDQYEIIVTIDANGKADGGHRFTKINDINFYIDDIRYTAQEGGLVVSGFDEAFFKGEAKLISQLMYDGRKLEVHAIGKEAFRGCKVLTSIVIPPSVTCIDDNAFFGCPKLASISIPNGVTKIGDNAFFFCPSLVSVTIPNSVKTIGKSAFYCCIGLTYLTISDNVTSIGGSAFYGCGSLNLVKMKKKTPVAIDGVTFVNQGNATLSVPFGSKDAYEAAEYWRDFKEIIEE